uniref:Uncharacterized protein n=1 Tax=Zea mays TaxID=4577 RepID=A0A804PZT0_MAIZE
RADCDPEAAAGSQAGPLVSCLVSSRLPPPPPPGTNPAQPHSSEARRGHHNVPPSRSSAPLQILLPFENLLFSPLLAAAPTIPADGRFSPSQLPLTTPQQARKPRRQRHVPRHHPVARPRGSPSVQGRETQPHVVTHGRHRAAPLLLLQGGLVRGGGAPGVRAPRARRPQGAGGHPPGPHLHLGRPAESPLPSSRRGERRRRRARRRGAPQVPPRAGLPRARRARDAAPLRRVARRVRRGRGGGRGAGLQGAGGRGGVHARVGPGRAPRVLQRVRRVQGQGHVRARLRRRRPPGALPPVARPGDGARRARAHAQAPRRQRHHTGDRPEGHAEAGAQSRQQPDPLPLPGQLPGDGGAQGVHQRAVVLLRALLHGLALPHGAHQEQVRHRSRGQRRRDAVQVHPAGAGAGAVRRAEPRRRARERTAEAGVRVHHQGWREGVPGDRRYRASLIRIPGRRNDNVGPRRRGLGPGVRRRVRAGGRRQLHPLRGEGEDGPGHNRRRRRRAAAQRLHGSGGRQDGAVHRQLRFPEAEGRRLPLLRAQAVGVA